MQSQCTCPMLRATKKCGVCRMYDFDEAGAETYKETCECGNVIEVSTLEDDSPAYYIAVFVKCQCGESVEFNLPAN